MTAAPPISVVMSAYNAEAHIKKAIESVLQQTFSDFEFIIIDDGSTDSTTSILEAYTNVERRIRLHQQANFGLTKSLNIGWRLSRAEFVARMDADDVCDPQRFEKQIHFLRTSPKIAAVGTWVDMINADGLVVGEWRPPSPMGNLLWTMIAGCPVAHPSAMIRREWLKTVAGYDERLLYAQDYDLWSRIVQAGGAIGNFPEKLLLYRQHAQQISQKNFGAQHVTATNVAADYLGWLLGDRPDTILVKGLRDLLAQRVDEIPSGQTAALAELLGKILETLKLRVEKQEFSSMRAMARRRLLYAARTLSISRPTEAVHLAISGAKLAI